MSDISFNIQPVEDKPKKKANPPQGSKYEPIINAFQASGHSLVRVEGTGLDANYLRGQLMKVLDIREIDSVEISVRNKEVYLEKRLFEPASPSV
jgi:hypothetical protein